MEALTDQLSALSSEASEKAEEIAGLNTECASLKDSLDELVVALSRRDAVRVRG